MWLSRRLRDASTAAWTARRERPEGVSERTSPEGREGGEGRGEAYLIDRDGLCSCSQGEIDLFRMLFSSPTATKHSVDINIFCGGILQCSIGFPMINSGVPFEYPFAVSQVLAPTFREGKAPSSPVRLFWVAERHDA